MTDLDRLKELLEKAQHPWTAWVQEQLTASDFPSHGNVIGLRWVTVDKSQMLHPDDAQLIALLRNLAPALLARLEALEGALRPFGEYIAHRDKEIADRSGDVPTDSYVVAGYGNPGVYLTAGDFRRAKELLEYQP